MRSHIWRITWVAVLLALGGGAAFAQQSTQPTDKVKGDNSGVIFYESFQGSSNTLGQVYKLDSTLGYSFNKYLEIDGGLPVYFVRPSETSTALGYASGNGIGNAYAQLRLTFENPFLNYAMILTGTAPTGSKDRGFSTGHATYDWTNHFDRPIFGLTPFANIGVADTVSDTPFFTRPFTSFGTVTHLEGGATLKIFPTIRVGASLYDIIPSGTQTVFSKFIPQQGGPAFAPPITFSRGRHGAFNTQHEAVGGPSLTRDNGASAWVTARVGRLAFLEAGYTRSVDYDLNTFTFGIGFDVGYLVRKRRGF